MKNVLGQNLKTFVIRIILFTFLMGTVYIIVENYFSEERISLAHCLWMITVKTWEDTNANRIWDENEVSLAGVAIYEDNKESTITNQFGIAYLEGGGLCANRPDEISAKPPPGYKRTTREQIETDTHSWKEPFLFGFIKE